MEYEDEYHEAMITILELLWGKDFMAPGGKGNVKNLVGGLELRNRRVLDIGSGLGGPAFVLASDYGANVVGIDIASHLVERARRRASELGLQQQTEFRCVTPGRLTFPDDSFDFVCSSGAFTQIEGKAGMFRECQRVLKPGGWLSCYDWMKSPGAYSEDMRYWFKMEGLTYAMKTPEQHLQLLEQAGFINVEINDRSRWYKERARQEYEQIKTELHPTLLALLGKEDTEHFVENWRALVVVCEKGEMLQVYCRAMKPEP